MGCKVENCVGVIVANWLIGKLVGVERFHNRLIKVNLIFGDVVWGGGGLYLAIVHGLVDQ